MPNYRRARIPGTRYFFTVNLQDRSKDLLTRHITLLRQSVKITQHRHPFVIDAWVVLPDHMHCIWTLPEGDADYSTRWKAIKFAFSSRLANNEARTSKQVSRGERGVWQRRFWEHTIRNETDFEKHFDYIHWNPVKHGYVENVGEWEFSTFHRAVRQGVYNSDWAGSKWTS